jgi:AraC-like DNA-binding protein
MIFHRARNRIAGIQAMASSDKQAPFVEIGEIWAGSDWIIDWHHNPGWEIYLQMSGTSEWQLADGSRHALGENGFYLIRPDMEHRLVRFDRFPVHFYYAVIPQDVLPRALLEHPLWQNPYRFGTNAESLALPFNGLIREISRERPWQMAVCAEYERVLCFELTRLTERVPLPTDRQPHPAAAQAGELIRQRLDYPWQVKELARICGVSTPHFIEVFRAEFGETPKQYLLRQRIEEAARRLRDTDQSITQIALDLSFSSSQHFARAFRQFKGQSARDFRQS